MRLNVGLNAGQKKALVVDGIESYSRKASNSLREYFRNK